MKPDAYERLRDIPAQAKQRADDAPVSISAYRIDPDRDFGPLTKRVMSIIGLFAVSAFAIEAIYQTFLHFAGGR
jgi:hypothetical protein